MNESFARPTISHTTAHKSSGRSARETAEATHATYRLRSCQISSTASR